MLSLALIVAAGIYLSAHLPEHVSLGPAIVLLGASALLLAGNVLALGRAEGFHWRRFLEIARWALLAYAMIAGHDRVRVPAQQHQRRRRSVRADALAGRVRGERAGADRLHGRARCD